MDDATLLEIEDDWFEDIQPAACSATAIRGVDRVGQQGPRHAVHRALPNDSNQHAVPPFSTVREALAGPSQSHCTSQTSGTPLSTMDPLLKLLQSSQTGLASGKRHLLNACSTDRKRHRPAEAGKENVVCQTNSGQSCARHISNREDGKLQHVHQFMQQGGGRNGGTKEQQPCQSRPQVANAASIHSEVKHTTA
jgi:hypothetical protein